jgi:hypothetical protein
MFKFTGIAKDAGCGTSHKLKGKAMKRVPKKKLVKKGTFEKGTFIGKAAKVTYHAPESDRAQEVAFDHAMLPKKNYVYTDTTFTAGKPSAIKTIIGNKRGGKLKLEKLFNGKMQVDTHDMDKEELDRYTAKHMLGDS